jgi:hypothetical protein
MKKVFYPDPEDAIDDSRNDGSEAEGSPTDVGNTGSGGLNTNESDQSYKKSSTDESE